MPVQHKARASLWGALALLCLTASPWHQIHARTQEICPPDKTDEASSVRHVIDGDTIILADGRHIRLIGINTPEVAGRNKPEEPFAAEARYTLIRILKSSDNRILLRYDSEQQDHYGRTLAHIFSNSGDSIQAQLLALGLATLQPHPPNTWNLECYHFREQQAQNHKRGLWQHPQYQINRTSNLGTARAKYQIIEGTVSRIGNNRKSVWLNLDTGVALRIDHVDLAYFETYDPGEILGAKVIARGWPYRRKGQWRMRIRHPLTLQIVTRNRPDETTPNSNK